jgi:hypothetical protein
MENMPIMNQQSDRTNQIRPARVCWPDWIREGIESGKSLENFEI